MARPHVKYVVQEPTLQLQHRLDAWSVQQGSSYSLAALCVNSVLSENTLRLLQQALVSLANQENIQISLDPIMNRNVQRAGEVISRLHWVLIYQIVGHVDLAHIPFLRSQQPV